MAIPNPNPNIADGVKCDNKTYSSNKIEALISTATDIEDLYIVRTQTVISGVSIAMATESNSTDPIAVTEVTGYEPIAITNVKAYGVHGSKVVGYAWLTSGGINYSLYNSSTTVSATTSFDVDILYKKS